MKKKSLIAFFMAITMAVVSGCVQNADPSSEGTRVGTESTENKKITFVLDWTPNTNHTGLFVAQEKGYFEEQGLEVEIIQPTEDSASLMVASGGAQFGITCQDTMAPAIIGKNALPIKAVAAILQHNTSGIISLKDSGIDAPKKMEGHNYATWENPVEQAMIRSIVEENGGKFEEIELIPSTVYDTITALKQEIDSVWIFYAWDGIATELQNLETNFLDFRKLNPVFDYYTPVIIANDEYLEKNADVAEKFLEATKKGYEFAIENPSESADILLKAAPELDVELVKASQEWISKQYKAEVERWGYIDPKRWDAFYDWLSENGLSEEKIPAGTGYTNDYLPN